MDSLKLRVPYVSVWDGGITVETSATINLVSGEVTEIDVANVEGLNSCEEEYVMLNDEIVYVYQDEHGFNCWADILGQN